MSVHWPEMIDNQENTVFLKPLVTSPKIEIGEFTYYNYADDPTAFARLRMLSHCGRFARPVSGSGHVRAERDKRRSRCR